jgi:AraC family transcriptional regulator
VSTTPGAVTVIPAELDVTWDVPVSNEFSMVLLPDARLQACADQLGGGRPVGLADRFAVDDPMTSQLLDLIDQEVTHGDRASSLFIEHALDMLYMQLIRAHASHGPIEARPPRRGLAPWQVKRVTSYMRDRLDQDVSLGELAVLVGLSRFHFCTAFRLATGCTPHQWFTAQRMARARQLLGDPALLITDVALAVGYATPSAFSASFRRLVGATPSEYRRQRASAPPG